MKPTQKSAPALQAPHNSGERVQNGDTALAGADTPSSVSTPAQDAKVLANCPFCGGHARLYQRQNAAALWHVACENCDAGPHSDLGKYEAIARWNTRATPQTPDAVREKVAAARSRIGAMKIAPCSGIASSRQAAKEFEEVLDALSTPSASAGPQAEAVKESLHYLWAIKVRLGLLYEMSTLDSRLLEQLSDEVDWVDAEIGRLRAHPQDQQSEGRGTVAGCAQERNSP